MVDNFDGQDVQTSGELWSQICSSLPEVQAPETSPEFTDSFHPAAHHEVQAGAQVNGTSSPSAQWKPMEDSESYLASLGISLLLFIWKKCTLNYKHCVDYELNAEFLLQNHKILITTNI